MNKPALNYLATLFVSAFICSIILLSGCSDSSSDETPLTDTTPNNEPITIDTTTVKDGTVVETAALVSLGEKLYNDTSLSDPAGQACASCHTPAVGFDDPDSADATSLGADNASIGNRNSPTASYAAHIPDSHTILRTPVGGGVAFPVLIGGLFLDGRAESLEEQAKMPFLNPVEMANANESAVIDSIKLAVYAGDFETLFGTNILDDVNVSYAYVADAIAAFERSTFFSPFTAKFDQVQNGNAVFTQAENRGQNLFNGKAQCDTCHTTPNGDPQVFSNFEYKNIGVPANNTLDIALGAPANDPGLGGDTGIAQDNGKFRTSNLRNIDITAPYMHNGVFTTLVEVVEFYNTRDSGFPDAPEVPQNMDDEGAIGELNLTAGEVQDLVAFLKTLTDQ
ncbi:MAG: cytochrome-c peroxidase [Gammaproteobacteria bacterium]|nr:cytochrome-c peroxidase [Gammaproteobacteria bacterium]